MTSPALADDVSLTTSDGEMALSGELIDFSDGFYVMRTEIGEVQVPASLVSCAGAACPASEQANIDFTIKGSDTIGAELMPLLVRGYAESQRAVVDSRTTGERQVLHTVIADEGLGETLFTTMIEDRGSSTGFRGMLDLSTQIGMSSRRIKGTEVQAFSDAGLGDALSFEQEHGIAVDGLLIVVHPDNPVDALTENQISELLSGKISNWSELGGADLPVTVYSRDGNSGTFATVSGKFLEPYDVSLSAQARIVSGNSAMSESVFGDAGGIGYVGFAFRGDNKPLGLISSCGIAAEASTFAAKTGEYPLQRTLYLYTTNAELPSRAQGLLAYAKSPAADGIIEKSGFIGFNIDSRDLSRSAQAIRTEIDRNQSRQELAALRELYIDMLEWRRLSPTFRFQTGSSNLDNASRRDLLRLTGYLSNASDINEIALVGFTDADGAFDANRTLGLARAEAVLGSISSQVAGSAFDPSTIQIKSYGELNPVACNSDFAGQRLNRRVEVWVR
ncbi:phosphate ABC transporter substrate-binding/OmpA family protein [Yoonia maritima]|uniref:phosphate ABC transporter substrate-binding/OmpA family protein n=1 Tax=Yoonia maritima TaxID=1435347 RepID=UPI0013A64A16|nr:phosphate ABC transporter substrate-binding/OmpA family protein [Yoonia maritima]